MKVAHKLFDVIFRWDVLICAAMALAFYHFPQIDLHTTQYFYENGRFPLNDHWLVKLSYQIFANIHFVYLSILLVALLALVFFRGHQATKWRKRTRFLLLVLVVAPGILVNIVIKDNSIGRPRPTQVQEFGGSAQFSPAFVYSGECSKNCSFVSGHAAIGFFVIALGWVFASRSLFAIGVLLGFFVGFGRIVQGAHFLSDVVFSFWVIYFATLVTAWLYNYRFSNQTRYAQQPQFKLFR